MTNIPMVSILDNKGIYYDPNSASLIEPPEEEKMVLEWKHLYGVKHFSIDLEKICYDEAYRFIWNSDRSYETLQTWRSGLGEAIETSLHENSMIQYLHNVNINVDIEKDGNDYWARVDVRFNDEHIRYLQPILTRSDIKF